MGILLLAILQSPECWERGWRSDLLSVNDSAGVEHTPGKMVGRATQLGISRAMIVLSNISIVNSVRSGRKKHYISPPPSKLRMLG